MVDAHFVLEIVHQGKNHDQMATSLRPKLSRNFPYVGTDFSEADYIGVLIFPSRRLEACEAAFERFGNTTLPSAQYHSRVRLTLTHQPAAARS
jgi:hypothetical protein